jgi:hypothetical protein
MSSRKHAAAHQLGHRGDAGVRELVLDSDFIISSLTHTEEKKDSTGNAIE